MIMPIEKHFVRFLYLHFVFFLLLFVRNVFPCTLNQDQTDVVVAELSSFLITRVPFLIHNSPDP